MAELQRLVRIGAIANLAGLIGQKLFAMASMVLIVRGLSIADFGRYSLFIAAVVLLANLTFGLDKIAQRYFPQLLKKDTGQAQKLMWVFLGKRLLVLLALAGLIAMLNHVQLVQLARFNVSHPLWALVVGILLAVRQYLTLLLNAAYLEHQVINVVLIFAEVLRFGLFLILWDGALDMALMFWAMGEVVILVSIAFRMLWRLGREEVSISPLNERALDYRRYYDYGKYFLFASFGTYILSVDTDYYFLSYYFNEEVVGQYAFSAKLPMLLLMLAPSQLLFNVALPLMMKREDEGAGVAASVDRIGTFVKVNLVVWTMMAGSLISTMDFIVVQVFDEKYLGATVFIQWWLIIYYLIVLKGVFEPIARAIEFSKVYLFTFVAALVNICGDALLVPEWGMHGALLATGSSILVQGAGISVAVTRKLGVKLPWKEMFRMTSLVVPVIGIAIYLQSQAGPAFVEQLSCLLIYLLLFVLFFMPQLWLTPGERRWVWRFAGKSI